MNRPVLMVGDVVTCAETGKTFTVQTDGCSVNYASNAHGEIFSDEGVDIREKRELLDRSRPFTCYLSRDGKTVGGWKGNVLGIVVRESTSRSGFHRSEVTAVTVRDVHGNYWHGRGAGRGMVLTLRPSKHAP